MSIFHYLLCFLLLFLFYSSPTFPSPPSPSAPSPLIPLFIILPLGMSKTTEIYITVTMAKSTCGHCCTISRGSRGYSVPYLFQLLSRKAVSILGLVHVSLWSLPLSLFCLLLFSMCLCVSLVILTLDLRPTLTTYDLYLIYICKHLFQIISHHYKCLFVICFVMLALLTGNVFEYY